MNIDTFIIDRLLELIDLSLALKCREKKLRTEVESHINAMFLLSSGHSKNILFVTFDQIE